jgi:hypothetical protein
MTIIRKEKKPGKDQPVVEIETTLEESIHFEEFPRRFGSLPSIHEGSASVNSAVLP